MSQSPGPPGAGTPSHPAGPRGGRRFGAGFAVLILLLVCLPIVELYLLIKIGQRIGVGWTLLLLVAEALFGGWLMRREGAKAWQQLTRAYGSGRLPSGELADAALILVGGALLMLPGVVTDVIGLIFLLPFTRPLARSLLGFVIARRVAAAGAAVRQRAGVVEGEVVADPPGGPTVIRGELDD